MRSVALLCFVLALSSAAPANAEPSIWERARNPSSVRVERALKRIELLLDGANEADDPGMIDDFQRGALAIAEMSGARALGDPRLLVLLAQALLAVQADREAEVTELLERALATTGPDELWLQAEIRPLLAAAARHDARRAVRAVNAALPLVWDESSRSFLLRERADAKMALGEVRASVVDARLALLAANSAAEKALCRYQIGLGLERSGDLPAALGELRLAQVTAATTRDDVPLDLTQTFVLRPLDADYVAGLAARALAEAERTAKPALALKHYENARASFATYVKASPREDRWLPAARSQLATTERAAAELKHWLLTKPWGEDEE